MLTWANKYAGMDMIPGTGGKKTNKNGRRKYQIYGTRNHSRTSRWLEPYLVALWSDIMIYYKGFAGKLTKKVIKWKKSQVQTTNISLYFWYLIHVSRCTALLYFDSSKDTWQPFKGKFCKHFINCFMDEVSDNHDVVLTPGKGSLVFYFILQS